MFPDAKDETVASLDKLGLEVVGEDRSPFGPVLKLQFNGARTFLSAATPEGITALAQLPGIQSIDRGAPLQTRYSRPMELLKLLTMVPNRAN